MRKMNVGSLLFFFALAMPLLADVWNPRTGERYKALGAALDAAGEGDTLRLSAGTYEGTAAITRSVTLHGDPGAVLNSQPAVVTISSGALDLTLRSLALAGAVISDADALTVEHCEILGTGSGVAVDMVWHPGPTTLRFTDNFVKGWQYAVRGERYAAGAVLRDNRLRAVANGFYLTDAPDVRIERNRIENYIDPESVRSIRRFYGGIGVGLVSCPRARVIKNTICGAHTGIRLDASPDSILDLNVVSGDTDALDNEYRSTLLDQLRGAGVPEDQLMYEYDSVARGKGGGVIVAGSDDVRVTRGRFCRGAYGLEINHSRRPVIEKNTIMLMTIGVDITPHDAPEGAPEWQITLGRNFYGAAGGLNPEPADDAIGRDRLTRRPLRVGLSDHQNRARSIAPAYDAIPFPLGEFLAICPALRGEADWTPPKEYDY